MSYLQSIKNLISLSLFLFLSTPPLFLLSLEIKRNSIYQISIFVDLSNFGYERTYNRNDPVMDIELG